MKLRCPNIREAAPFSKTFAAQKRHLACGRKPCYRRSMPKNDTVKSGMSRREPVRSVRMSVHPRISPLLYYRVIESIFVLRIHYLLQSYANRIKFSFREECHAAFFLRFATRIFTGRAVCTTFCHIRAYIYNHVPFIKASAA